MFLTLAQYLKLGDFKKFVLLICNFNYFKN